MNPKIGRFKENEYTKWCIISNKSRIKEQFQKEDVQGKVVEKQQLTKNSSSVMRYFIAKNSSSEQERMVAPIIINLIITITTILSINLNKTYS